MPALDPDAPLADCLARLGAGDPGAWTALVERGGGLIAAVCARVAGADAEDALQDALIALRSRARRFRGGGDDAERAARAWLTRLATSSAIEVLRARTRAHRRETVAASAAVVATEDDAASGFERREAEALLRRELARLPAVQREAVALHHLAGEPIAAVAAAQGIAPEAAKKRVQRGVERLRERLARTGLALAPAAVVVLLADAADAAPPSPIAAAATRAAARAAAPLTTLSGALAMATAACTPLITLVALVAWRGGAAEPLPVGDARPPAADQEFAWRVAAAPLFDAHVAVDLGGTAEEDAAALSRASGLAIAVAPEAVASHGRGRHHDDDIEVGLAIDRLAALAHGEVHMIGPRAVRIVALPLDPATAWAAREVTLSFEEVPLRDALARLAAASGVRIVVADDVGDPPPLTLAVTTMSTRNALDFITRLTGLHWQHQPDGSVVISRAQLPPNDEQRADAARAADAAARTRSIDQAVQAAWSAKATAVLARPMTPLPPGIALADAISQLQARSGLNIIVAPEVLAADAGRAVTVDARARTIGDVLSAVAEQAGCDIRRGQRTILLASKGASTQR